MLLPHWGYGLFGFSPGFTHYYPFSHFFCSFPPHTLFSRLVYGENECLHGPPVMGPVPDPVDKGAAGVGRTPHADPARKRNLTAHTCIVVHERPHSTPTPQGGGLQHTPPPRNCMYPRASGKKGSKMQRHLRRNMKPPSRHTGSKGGASSVVNGVLGWAQRWRRHGWQH